MGRLRWLAGPGATYSVGSNTTFWSASNDKEQKAMLSNSVKPVFDAGFVHLEE